MRKSWVPFTQRCIDQPDLIASAEPQTGLDLRSADVRNGVMRDVYAALQKKNITTTVQRHM
jgi:hypothetical protein